MPSGLGWNPEPDRTPQTQSQVHHFRLSTELSRDSRQDTTPVIPHPSPFGWKQTNVPAPGRDGRLGNLELAMNLRARIVSVSSKSDKSENIIWSPIPLAQLVESLDSPQYQEDRLPLMGWSCFWWVSMLASSGPSVLC